MKIPRSLSCLLITSPFGQSNMSEDISAPFSSEGKENQSWYENRIKAMWGGLYEMLHRPPRVLAQGDLQKALHETLVRFKIVCSYAY